MNAVDQLMIVGKDGVIGLTKTEAMPRVAAEGALFSFVVSDCYFPTEVGVDEEFIMKFLCSHDGPAALFWLGFSYKGLGYVFTELNGISLQENQGIRIEFMPFTIQQFLEPLGEQFDETKTISITFRCGYIEGENHYYTDSLDYDCKVVVENGLIPWKMPIWGWIAGAFAAVGLVVVAARPWKKR